MYYPPDEVELVSYNQITMNNRLHNCTNPHQGDMLRTLVVCSAGLLRSPTLAWILSNPPFNHNTRAAGSVRNFALVHADDVLLTWADLVVFVNRENHHDTKLMFPEELAGKLVIVLDIPDNFRTRDPELVKIATKQLHDAFMLLEQQHKIKLRD